MLGVHGKSELLGPETSKLPTNNPSFSIYSMLDTIINIISLIHN